jgi:hypothetical protein
MKQPPCNDYFSRRADEEHIASKLAADERAARSHRELAKEYRKRASRTEAGEPDRRAATLSRGFRIIP